MVSPPLKLDEGVWNTVTRDGSDITVRPLRKAWNLVASQGKYDLSVFGPNGFLRQFSGVVVPNAKVDLDVDVYYDVDDDTIVVRVTNQARVSA